MKRITSMLLLIGLLCTLCACGKTETAVAPAAAETSVAATEVVAEEAPAAAETSVAATEVVAEEAPAAATKEEAVEPLFSYEITEFLTEFSNGYAWVEFKDGGQIITDDGCFYGSSHSAALINENYEAVYETHLDYEYEYSFHSLDTQGFAYYSVRWEHGGTKDENKTYHDIIIDCNGNQTYCSENDDENTYVIVSGGDGKFLQLHTASSFSQAGAYLRAIDSSGNVLSDEFDATNLMKNHRSSILYNGNFQYVGNSIFALYDYYGVDCIFNLGTNNCFYPEHDLELKKLLPNSECVVYVYADGISGMYNSKYYKASMDIFESEDAYERWYASITKSTETYTKFKPPVNYGDSVKVLDIGNLSGEYYPVLLKGADGNRYYTIVDENGKGQYEPVKLVLGSYDEPDSIDELAVHDSVLVYAAYIKALNGSRCCMVNTDGTETEIPFSTSEIDGYDGRFLYSTNGSSTFRAFDLNTQKEVCVIYSHTQYTQQASETATTNGTTKTYITPSNFAIEGKWKNVGTYTFGQIQSGAIVVFDGTNCNVYSPSDTYAFYKDGDHYKLDCTSMLFSETLSFAVKIVDDDHIDIYNGDYYLEMQRVQ